MKEPIIVVPPREKDLGGDLIVRRILPWAKRKTVGPFVFWDHMGPTKLKLGNEMQVRAHPHIGLSTLTYLFEGTIRHRDTLGIIQDITPGGINWMTAGRGIAHSERTHPEMGLNQNLHGIQIWVALPKDKEELEPSFHHIPKSDVPKIQLGKHKGTVIAGSYAGHRSPVPIHSELVYLDIEIADDSKCQLDIPTNFESAIYVAMGSISVAGKFYRDGEMLVWDDVETIEFSSGDKARVLLLAGKAFPEKRHVWWNFVSSSKERIEQAKQDWLDGKFGKVVDESEYIPLPND